MKNIIKTITTILAFIVFTLFSSCKYEETTDTNLLSLLAVINMQPEKRFTVTLNENNGSSNPAVEEQIFTSKSCTLKSAKNLGFSKENHVFKGWSLSPSSTEIAHTDAETFMPETDISLYAIWQEASELKSVSQIRDIFAKLVNTEPDYSDYVYFIKAFKSADTAPASPEFFLDKNNTIPVFYDKDTSTIYYYSAGAKLKLPENASGFFKNMYYLEYIETKDFDTSGVTDMSSMFTCCSRLINLDLSNFNTENVTDMRGLFCGCSSLENLNIKKFNTQNVTTMEEMFNNCGAITIDVSSFNTAKVKNMNGMFAHCSFSSIDLRNFKTSNVTEMRFMFGHCHNLKVLDLSNFDTSNVIDMSVMFCECTQLQKINMSTFNTSNLQTMTEMFHSCKSLYELDLSSFDFSNIELCDIVFVGCTNLHKIYTSSNTDLSQQCEGNNMFHGCVSLEGGAGTKYSENHTDSSYAKVDGGPSSPGYFSVKE